VVVTTPDPLPQQPAQTPSSATPTRPRNTRSGWLAPVIIGLAVGFLLGAGATTAAFTLSTSTGDDSEQKQILSTCHEAVKERLKAPATAQFSMEEITNSNTSVRGAVDAQNGFGALIRSTFTCTMSHADGKWQTVDVALSKN
jgi:hypothetical protein